MAPSRRRRKSSAAIDCHGWALIAALLLAVPAQADGVAEQALELQLEVSINGQPTHLIGAFTLERTSRLSATRGELAAIGIAVPGSGPSDAPVSLDDIEGLTYRYDHIAQSIAISAPDGLRIAKSYNGASTPEAIKPETSTGALLNYTIYTEASANLPDKEAAINGGSANLDARAFSPLGSLRQTGIIGTTTFDEATALRLDSSWSYSDVPNLRTYNAGDITSGGLSWTRPIRMGGAQVQRDFGLRPGLVTMPLPSFTGSAAVPSTIDVYINNVKSYSQQVGSGPYSISNIPVITGSGQARVVVTDSTGRESVEQSSFFATADLLRKGLVDYSADVGVARLNYGTQSFAYGKAPLAAASLRYGISDWLTGEVHGEAGSGVINGGFGAVAGLGKWGAITGAFAASTGSWGSGGMLFAGWESEFASLSLNASTRRAFGRYADLATATSEDSEADSDYLYTVDAKAVDQLSVAYGFRDALTSLGVGLIHVEDGDGSHSLIASGTVTKSFAGNLSLYASGFAQAGSASNYGLFAGLSYTFGHDKSAAAAISASGDGMTASAIVAKSMDGSPGSYGWRVAKGIGGTDLASASATYLGKYAELQGTAFQQDDGANLNLSLDGSLVAAGGGVFLGNRIDDAFAVVDAGDPGVPVMLENRPAGRTGSNGKLLVTGLKAYENNKLSLDITNLPVSAEIPRTETNVIPERNSGVTVDFGVKSSQDSAIVVVTDADGKPLQVGSTITIEGHDQPFLVGFDGETYVTGIAATNRFEATANSVACSGIFQFTSGAEEQQVIGPVKCM